MVVLVAVVLSASGCCFRHVELHLWLVGEEELGERKVEGEGQALSSVFLPTVDTLYPLLRDSHKFFSLPVVARLQRLSLFLAVFTSVLHCLSAPLDLPSIFFVFLLFHHKHYSTNTHRAFQRTR